MDSKGFLWGFFVDFCKDSRNEGIIKDFYKDASWIGINGISVGIL
jgi:hypothetical protein